MFLLRQPSNDMVSRLLAGQRDKPLTYGYVGETRRGRIPGLPVNHHRAVIGQGEETFRRAVAALGEWGMYQTPSTRVVPPETPVEENAVMAVVVRHPGFWSVNPCRVVYTFDERGEVERVGFAIGTLPQHSERGEERFSVEWRHCDDSVWFEVFACAGPRHPLVRLGYPAMRLTQFLFGKAAMRAMRKIVGTDRL